jgi:hypothetical protein
LRGFLLFPQCPALLFSSVSFGLVLRLADRFGDLVRLPIEPFDVLQDRSTPLFQFHQLANVGSDPAISAVGDYGLFVIQNELSIQHGNKRRCAYKR